MKTIIIMLILFTGFGFVGCKDFVEIDSPKTELISNTVFNDDETANAAMLTVYGQLFAPSGYNSYMISLFTGLSSDELKNNNTRLVDVYGNNIVATFASDAHNAWKVSYNVIYAANSVYEGCKASTELTPKLKDQLMGEALFVRAYCYFYLVNLYGALPLALSTDYKVNNSLYRTPEAQIYAQIIADLKDAQVLLNENYLGADGKVSSVERVRSNKAVATALLARVSLYTGDFESAERLATSLIENTNVYSLVPISQVFQKNNKEAIWQIMQTNNPSTNTREGANYTITAIPASQSKAELTTYQLNVFEPGDLRLSSWVGQYTDPKPGGLTYYYPGKYKQLNGTSILEYSVSFRLAEQYLIRAEARNERDNPTGAIADLNEVRKRARATASPSMPNPLPALGLTLLKSELKTAILHERQVELFTEYGHRWFDLKRTKTIDAVMIPASARKGYTWNSDKQVWPIPNTEILNNPNLIQNKGYDK